MIKKFEKICSIIFVVIALACFDTAAMEMSGKKISAYLAKCRALEKSHPKGCWDSAVAKSLIDLYDQLSNNNARAIANHKFKYLFWIDIDKAKQRIKDENLKEATLKNFSELCAQIAKKGNIKQLLASGNIAMLEDLLRSCRNLGSGAERIFQDTFGASVYEARRLMAQSGEESEEEPEEPKRPAQPQREEVEEPEAENDYIIFEYQKPVGGEPNLVITPNNNLQQAPSDQAETKKANTSSINKSKQTSKTNQLYRQPVKEQSACGMTAGPRTQENEYCWTNISRRLPPNCQVKQKKKRGMRHMWIGCLDNVKSAAIALESVRHVWVLVHGTWGHQTPSFFDENHDNFQEIQATIREQAHERENALLLSFRWTGENSVEAREKGARRLKQCLARMQLLKWATLLTIVAHSHGCNLSSNFSQLLDKDTELIRTLLYFACPRRPEAKFQPESYDNLVYFWGVDDLIASLGSIDWSNITSNLKSSWVFHVSNQAIDVAAAGLAALGLTNTSKGVKALGTVQLGNALYIIYAVATKRAITPDFNVPQGVNAQGTSIMIGTKVQINGRDILKPVNIHSYIVNALCNLRAIFRTFGLNNTPQNGRWNLEMNSDGSQFDLH